MVQKQEFYRQTIQELQPACIPIQSGDFLRRRRNAGFGKTEKTDCRRQKKVGAAKLLEQLNDPLIYVLLAAALISVLLGEYSDAGLLHSLFA